MSFSEGVLSLSARRKKRLKFNGNFSSWLAIGAICESSPRLARRMKEAIGECSLPVVELGAGYGSVTRILPEATVSIEREPKRFEYLKGNFPNRTIIDSCAIPFLADLREPTVIVSSIPSVNNPEFSRLRASVARARRAGMVVKLITYSYFPHSPFAGVFPKSEMVGLEVVNIPPAFVWRYTC